MIFTCQVVGFLLLTASFTSAYYYGRPVRRLRLNGKAKKFVINTHNSFRRIVVPQAAKMQFMEWGDDLEKTALWRSETCPLSEATGRMLFEDDVDNVTENIGENYYVTSSLLTRSSVMYKAMSHWYGKGAYYVHKRNKCRGNHYCDPYTQIVHDNTTKVGCGITICTDNISLYTSVFCDYSPGLYPAANPYTRGRACSECVLGVKCRRNLCGEREEAFGNTTDSQENSTYTETTAASLVTTGEVQSSATNLRVNVFTLISLQVGLVFVQWLVAEELTCSENHP